MKILGGFAIGFGAPGLFGQLGSPLFSVGFIAAGVYILNNESRKGR